MNLNPQVQHLIDGHAQLSAQEVAQRNQAQGILSPDDVAGDYEAALRQLTTTIDGQHRAITYEDLKRFKHHMAHFKGKLTQAGHSGGLTAKTIINLSSPSDRERAQHEIKTALPLRKDGKGVVVFRTNASAQSESTHHLVHVRFLAFAAVLVARKVDDKLIKGLTNGLIKFDCDCGRHRYWYRFIASAGGFNEGRAETGYPKIRNPRLKGLACKHVLRVMSVIGQSPSFKAFAKQWISAYRHDVSPLATDQSDEGLTAFAQAFQKESWRQRQVRPAKTPTKRTATRATKKAAQTPSKSPKGEQLKPIALAAPSKAKATPKAPASAQAATPLTATQKQKYRQDLQAALRIGAISRTTYELALQHYA